MRERSIDSLKQPSWSLNGPSPSSRILLGFCVVNTTTKPHSRDRRRYDHRDYSLVIDGFLLSFYCQLASKREGTSRR